MACSASALPWLWVIEALAIVKQVDASVLKELAKRTAEITSDLGKDAGEMINFRVLDILTSQQVRSNGSVPSALASKTKIDPLECCENVVRLVLHERTGKAEMLKSEVRDFVAQKRASLPKCTLQKLKDAILEGKLPALASLKEKSGLSTSNRTREGTATNYAVSSVAVGLSDSQTVGGDLFSPNAKNLNDLSQKDSGNKNLTPYKRDTSYLERENEDFRSHINSLNLDNASDAHLQITKKLKHNASVSGLVVGHEPLPAAIEERPVALVDELELDFSDKEARDDGRCCAENGTSNAAPSNGAHENICSNPNPNMEKSHQRQFNGVPHDEFHSNNFPLEAQHDMDHNPGLECFIDSDGYHEERLDIARKRCNFLSSQCTFTRNSLAIDDCTELNFCMRCEKGGELLVCSATACPIVVHHSCLGTAPSFNNIGKFVIPREST